MSLDADTPTDADGEIVIECDLAAPPHTVWRALTVPELVATWLLPNTLEARVGAKFALDGAPAGLADRIECEVLAADPDRLLRYSWRERRAGDSDPARETVVTFRLAANADGGTRLRIVQAPLAAADRTRTLMLRATNANGLGRWKLAA